MEMGYLIKFKNMNLEESYEYCVNVLKRHIDKIDQLIITESNSEFYIGLSEKGTALRIVKVKFPFLMIYIENHEVNYNFDQFKTLDTVKILLCEFVDGNYHVQFNSITNKLATIWWDKEELFPFEFGMSKEELRIQKGVSFQKINK
ncbi:MAG: hypothetical protein RLZ33_1124 [Bacteroidota bacterium]|jgi:hypothetical protein